MSKNTLLDRVWDNHAVRMVPVGQTQLFIALHLIHEVTSPQAFAMLDERGLPVPYPERTLATVDHIVPTDSHVRPLVDPLAEAMLVALERNTAKHAITFFGLGHPNQGIVHVIGPQLGLTQPGLTIACGDSHTSTHGAFGAIAFGIGTTQVANVLASQTLLISKPKVRRVEVTGQLSSGVTAKDVILAIIGQLGVNGGIGFAYEYGGSAIEALDMEARMTICNMSIEGGARCGYINPDQVTVEYLRGRPYTGDGPAFDKRAKSWLALASGPDAGYDEVVTINGTTIEPMVTWGTNPGQVVGVNQPIPKDADPETLEFMGFLAGQRMVGVKIDVAFIGSCINGRISDLRRAAKLIADHGLKVAPHVRAIVVPGSVVVGQQAINEGLDEVFRQAGFDFRAAGCSMCLAMNPDKLQGRQICASSSNRNFRGRQGSPTGRTLLMSPEMVVIAAANGEVTDIRTLCGV